MVAPFRPDYEAILNDVERRMSLNIETYTGSRFDQSISSGLLCIDLLLGNGGWVPGLHTSLGFEQSAKTTLVILLLIEAVRAGIPVKKLWDYEKSFDPRYASRMFRSTLKPNSYGMLDDKGKWIERPVVNAYDTHTAEDFFDAVYYILVRLPRKRKIGGSWFYVYPDTAANRKMLSYTERRKTVYHFSKTLLQTTGKLCVEAEDGRPQMVLTVDSYPAMLPEYAKEDQGRNKAMAATALMFSNQIKRVKALIASRNIVWLGVNQMRLKPGQVYGPNEYEPCGEALKINSDIRLRHRACAIPQSYEKLAAKEKGHQIEKSIYGSGHDSYRFITVDVVKNKVGGAIAGTRIHQRIWEYDRGGIARGIDPVFDCWQYLMLTGQLDGTARLSTLHLADGTTSAQIKWPDFKALIIGKGEQRGKALARTKLSSDPRLLTMCRRQLLNGDGYALFNKAA